MLMGRELTFEETVVDPIDHGGVEVGKRDGWVFDTDLDGFNQGTDDDISRTEVGLCDLGLRTETVARCKCTNSLSAAEQDGWSMGLGKEKVENDTYRGGNLPTRSVPNRLVYGIGDCLTHRISQSEIRQPSTVTAKPARSGPREGPPYAAETHIIIP